MSIFVLSQDATGNTVVQSTTDTPAGDAPGIVVRPQLAAAAVDFFGRQRISEPAIVFQNTPAYGLSDLTWQTIATGTSNAATWDANTRSAIFTLTSTGHVVRQTYRYVVYQMGRPVRVLLTGTVGAAVAGVTKEFGQGDAANGVFWRQTATGELALVKRSSTTGSVVDQVIPRTSWNGDKLDGTGSSGLTLDVTKGQVFFIEYAWLGQAGVRWGVLVNGAPVYVHTQVYANTLANSYMQTATLPIRWAAYAASDPATPAVLTQVCSAVESEGGYITAPALSFSAGRPVGSAISAASEVPLVAIRPALLIPATTGIVNRVQVDVQDIDVYAASGAIDWRLLWFPHGSTPITGGAWARPYATSAVEANVSGTALTLTNAVEIARGSVPAGGATRGAAIASVVSALPLSLDACGSNSPLTSAAGANPSYLVLSALGSGATASGGLRWWESR